MTKRIFKFSKLNIISLIFFVVVTGSLWTYTFVSGGFNLGIDFQSGQTIDIKVAGTDPIQLNNVLNNEMEKIVVTRLGNSDADMYNIKLPSTKESQQQDLNKIVDIILGEFGEPEVLSTSFIGSGISQNLFRSVLILTIGALVLILLYVSIRFKIQFSLSAILALVHDILFIIGIIGTFKIEVSVSTVAAVLTIIGYSLNDTIVIFDRIRENIVLMRGGNFNVIADTSISQTLSRTLITSLTTLLAIFALMIFATGDIFNFAKVLFIGIVEGTLSSLFIATPVVSLFNHKKLLELYRKKQGSGVQYTSSSSSPEGKSQVSAHTQAITDQEVERIKKEVLAKQKNKNKK